jgi:hypothetical protein
VKNEGTVKSFAQHQYEERYYPVTYSFSFIFFYKKTQKPTWLLGFLVSLFFSSNKPLRDSFAGNITKMSPQIFIEKDGDN